MEPPRENHATGEEVYKRAVPYSRILQDGDPRMKRVINMMRYTAKGNQVYNYATSNGIKLKWQNSGNHYPSYSSGLVKIPASLPDKIYYWQAHMNSVTLGKT